MSIKREGIFIPLMRSSHLSPLSVPTPRDVWAPDLVHSFSAGANCKCVFNEENPLRLSSALKILYLHTSISSTFIHTIAMSAQETTKGWGDKPIELGACSAAGCVCPAFVGKQVDCFREGCGHSELIRKISATRNPSQG